MRTFFRFSRIGISLILLGVSAFCPRQAHAGKRSDSPKGTYGTNSEIFSSAPVMFTLSDGTSFTLLSSVRCQSNAPADCLSANSVFVYFYVITIGTKAVSEPFTLQLTAPFDNYNSPALTFGILNQLDSASNGTKIADCLLDPSANPPTYNAACISAVLQQSTNYTNGTLTFNLSPQTLPHAFQPGDQVWVYATSFSPPACPFNFASGLLCNQNTSLTASLLVSSANGPVSPSSTPGLAPVLPTPGRRLLAPSESAYFPGKQDQFPVAINAQLNQGGSTTALPGFVTSSVDLLFGSNVSFGYLYSIQIPPTLDVTLLPATFTVTLSAPYNQSNFEFLSFGVLGTDGHTESSSVANCQPAILQPSTAANYNACVDSFVTGAAIQGTSLTFTIATKLVAGATADISAGDNLTLFASSNNGPSICATQGQPCFNSTTPIALAGDSFASLSVSGSPTTVTGPIQPLPVPSITALNPNTAPGPLMHPGACPGGVCPVILISGQSFVVGAQTQWNGSPRSTTFLSSGALEIQLDPPAGVVIPVGPYPITVTNPANPSTPPSFTPNGGTSNSSEFLVTNNSPTVKLTQPVVSVIQPVGTVSSVQTIQLQNIGANTLNLTSIALAGPDPSPFALIPPANVPAPACPLSGGAVAAGATCNIAFTFTSADTNTHYATVMVSDSAPDSPQSAILVGTGLGPATLTLVPH